MKLNSMKKIITNYTSRALQKGIAMMLLICLTAWSAFAQDVQISGQVLDESGLGLPGATVMELGTSNGTTTDLEGNFTLSVADPSSSLTVSFIGYKTQTLDVGSKSTFSVNLDVDAQSLEEVIVVGYGEQTRQTLTGAVEVVGDEAFESQAVNSPILSLQGQTPGLVVSRDGARPGEGDVTIRGITSINNSDVLYVIDGVISVKTEFYNMNPDDIESVTVLKDQAAAIYGSRAANGVLLITTKKGSGKMTVEYSGSYRLKKIGRMPAIPSMEEFGAAWLAAVDGEGNEDYLHWGTRQNLLDMMDGQAKVYQTTVSAWGDNGAMYMAPSNRFDDMYGDASSQMHNVSISGSTENTSYRLSGNFSDDVGASKTAYDGQKQYAFRLNLDQKLNDKLSMDLALSQQKVITSGPSTGFQGNSVNNDPPIFPAYNPYGQWYANFGIGDKNSVAQNAEGGRENDESNITKINVGLTAQIVEGLEFRAVASYRQTDRQEDKTVLSVPLYSWDGQLQQSVNGTSYYSATFYESARELYNGQLTYSKTLGEGHNFKLMAGVSAELSTSSNIEARRDGLEDLGVYDLKLGTGVQTNTSDRDNSGFYSYFGRFNYDYKEKYLLELVGRADGTSRFDEGHKWQNYFGASAGWVLTEESFLENNSILSFLKLKASWGELGNLPGTGVIANHGYVSQIAFNTTPFGESPSNQTRARVSEITTDQRTWERVQLMNFGTEFTLLNHRITGGFDYFIKDNPNMLARQDQISLLGGQSPAQNIGHLTTKGWEAVIGWQDQVGDFNYSISANMSDSRNELISLFGAESWVAGLNDASNGVYREGYPLNAYWMYETDGLFQSQAEVDAYYDTYTSTNQGVVPAEGSASTLRPGDVIKKDLDGNGIIEATNGETGGDLKFMGDAQAHYTFGINSSVSWKGFDVMANFQGHLQQFVQRTGNLAYPFRAAWTNQTPAFIGLTWTEDNTDAEFPRGTTNGTRSTYNWSNNDYRLQNSQYIRLKTLIVGYTLPKSLTDAVKMQSVRVYFSGNDLWEATSLDDGFDPENGASTGSGYPFMRSYALGISAKF